MEVIKVYSNTVFAVNNKTMCAKNQKVQIKKKCDIMHLIQEMQ